MRGAIITDSDEVAGVAEALVAAGSFTLDLEFVSEGRYTPDLALVQVGFGDVGDPAVIAIDPLVADPTPVFQLVADEAVEVVLHAGQADLAILSASFDITPTRVWDTQIGAAFVGLGDQVGYANAVNKVLGQDLDKASQFTDWLRRPLTDKQLAYALDDVRYLGLMWSRIRGRLEELGRLHWVAEESMRMALTADKRPTPPEAYRKVKGWRKLRGRSLGALRGLAGWREEEARRVNRPINRVLPERTMLEMARVKGKSVQDFAGIRGADQGQLRRHGDAMLAALRAGWDDIPEAGSHQGSSDARADGWSAVVQGIVRALAMDAELAPRYVATRADLDAVTDWWLRGDREQTPDIPLLHGWRRAVAGDAVLHWLRGEAGLFADRDNPAGLRLGGD